MMNAFRPSKSGIARAAPFARDGKGPPVTWAPMTRWYVADVCINPGQAFRATLGAPIHRTFRTRARNIRTEPAPRVACRPSRRQATLLYFVAGTLRTGTSDPRFAGETGLLHISARITRPLGVSGPAGGRGAVLPPEMHAGRPAAFASWGSRERAGAAIGGVRRGFDPLFVRWGEPPHASRCPGARPAAIADDARGEVTEAWPNEAPCRPRPRLHQHPVGSIAGFAINIVCRGADAYPDGLCLCSHVSTSPWADRHIWGGYF